MFIWSSLVSYWRTVTFEMVDATLKFLDAYEASTRRQGLDQLSARKTWIAGIMARSRVLARIMHGGGDFVTAVAGSQRFT
jgi:hypothetical protein